MSAVKPEVAIPSEVFDLLACPACYAPLAWLPGAAEDPAIGCIGCGRLYPVQDGIPILLADRSSLPRT